MMIKRKIRFFTMTVVLITMVLSGTAIAKIVNGIDIEKVSYSTGVIDRLSDKEIVINDMLYTITAKTLFLSRLGAKIEIRWFKKGDKIRFVSNSKNEAVILRKQ